MSPNFAFSEEDAAIQIKEWRIKCSKVKKLLGIHIDYKFKSDTRCWYYLQKNSQKTHCTFKNNKLYGASWKTYSYECVI